MTFAAGVSKPFVRKFSINPFERKGLFGQRRESTMFDLNGTPARKERIRAVLWRGVSNERLSQRSSEVE